MTIGTLSIRVNRVNKLATLFGENVKKQRKSRGISREDLAHICGIDRSYMSRVERGIVRITLEKVYIIAIALGCEPGELLPSIKIRHLLQ
jgi:transcriptional regulator with XRE-family HTH domain